MLTVFEELPPVFLIRHCLDEEKRNMDDIDRNLSKKGMEQAVAVGDYLRDVQKLGGKTVVLCADLRRTTQTARIISEVLGPEDEGNFFISSALTEFGGLEYSMMNQKIAEVTGYFGDFRAFFVKELVRLSPGYELNPQEPIPVVTQRPVIARLLGIKTKKIPYAGVYQYPPPGGVAINLVESRIN